MSTRPPRMTLPISRRVAVTGLGALLSASALPIMGAGRAAAREDEIIRAHGYSFLAISNIPPIIRISTT